jgi:CBS domain-containing protein
MSGDAEKVLKGVEAVREHDSAVRALKLLSRNGVVVLVDEDNHPVDILTSADIDEVRARTLQLAGGSPASSLFPRRRSVVSVDTSEGLSSIARTVGTRRLSPGVVVTDSSGRYVGYIFNDDLRQQAEAFIADTREKAQSVEKRFPEAWRLMGGITGSSSSK